MRVFYRCVPPGGTVSPGKGRTMRGYVAKRRNRFYAVIYDGIDPISGRERRRWHPAGTDRAVAEQLASRLASDHGDCARSAGPTLGTYLTRRWLPTKQLTLRPSTWDSYRRNIELHVLPSLGRVPLRQLRAEHLERLYANLLDAGRADERGGGLDANTVLEIHMVLRRALTDAMRRGLISRNPAEIAHAPKRRPLASAEMRAWNAQQLNAFLQLASDHSLFTVFWLAANTGMRRGELLGLRWGDVDLDDSRLSVSRALISVGYELHESRGKTRTARRTIDLDPRTLELLRCARRIDVDDDSYVFCHDDGSPIHPQVVSDAFKKLVGRSGLPRIRLHDLRHTHATLLLKAGVPIKVVSERLGHSTPAFTMATYQHVLPGMQAEAARTFAAILDPSTGSTRWNTR
jgi:integrase